MKPSLNTPTFKQYVPSDVLHNQEAKFDKMKQFGVESLPIDLNGGLVQEKIGNGMGRAEDQEKEMQAAIRVQFGLRCPMDYKENNY